LTQVEALEVVFGEDKVIEMLKMVDPKKDPNAKPANEDADATSSPATEVSGPSSKKLQPTSN